MKEAEIKAAVFEGLAKIAPEADLKALPLDENIRQTLDIDSFDFLNFLIGLHERVGVDIPEADYGKLASLSDLIGYLSARVG